MKVYIAAPFFTPEQLNQVKQVEEICENFGIDYFSPRSFGVIKDMTEEEKEMRMHSIYLKNVREIEGATVIVVLVDHKDTGTTWELGYTAGINSFSSVPRNVITVSFEKKPVNLMLRYCIDAHITSYESLADILTCLNDGFPIMRFKNKMPEVNE